MKVSSNAIAAIKKMNGFREEAYLDADGVPAIGYGTTKIGKAKVSLDMVCTEEEAEAYLLNDLSKFEKQVSALVSSKISQSQFDALVCFAFDLGVEILQTSTLLKLVNTNPNDLAIHDEFMKYRKAGKRLLLERIRRRLVETQLYFS